MSIGYRIGKGEGFADTEYAIMACMGAVCESTVVVTIVHDCQVSRGGLGQHFWPGNLEIIQDIP